MEDRRFLDRLRPAWNAFTDKKVDGSYYFNYGPGYSYRPDRLRLTTGNERSIISSIYTRIAIDVSSIKLEHIKVDENERYLEPMQSGLNRCLNYEANIDQTGKELIRDIVMSMCDEGVIAVVPVDTSIDPKKSASYDIHSMRTAEILEWYPRTVKVRLYNDRTGQKEDLTLPKNMVAIIENPLYAVMNEPNSTLSRLIGKLNLLDSIDNQSGSGKLDLIIQLPYVIKSETREAQAEARRKAIEDQLAGSKYGIAYTDGTEKVTQLNRPAENNLMGQIEYLTSMLYSQLGLTEEIFNGTADEKALINYYNRTVSPIISSIVDNMSRKFITKTGRSQGQRIHYIRNPFSLVPAIELANIADKFTRNEILTSNEFRAVIGYKPVNDPKADELRNKNLNAPESTTQAEIKPVELTNNTEKGENEV